MDIELESRPEKNVIRKIEDIIDIQKANGSIDVRQVAFRLPSETNSNISTTCAKSLETGFSKVKLEKNKRKIKKRRIKHIKTSSDVISWPSDSDITVLRMKLSRNMADDKISNVVLGDGVHQSDSSSMVNLATLIIQSQPPSKHSFNIEEYLLPLTSWEHAATEHAKDTKNSIVQIPNAPCENRSDKEYDSSLRDNDVNSEITVKTKMARFLRLYFCPCCTCLYNLETLQEKQKLNYE